MCHCLPSLLLFSSCSPTCPAQVLARRLSPDSWDGESSVSVIPGADLRAVPGQVCGVRQDERRRGGSPALLLHDRRQGGQDPGAAGELWGGGAEQRHRGATGRRNRSGRRASDNLSTSVILSFVLRWQVLEGKPIHVDCYGNLSPLTKSGQQLVFNFYSFKENRLPFNVKVPNVFPSRWRCLSASAAFTVVC